MYIIGEAKINKSRLWGCVETIEIEIESNRKAVKAEEHCLEKQDQEVQRKLWEERKGSQFFGKQTNWNRNPFAKLQKEEEAEIIILSELICELFFRFKVREFDGFRRDLKIIFCLEEVKSLRTKQGLKIDRF